VRTTDRVDVTVRPYRDEDETAVLELLDASLGGGPAGRRPASFFRWKHLENPFGRSYMLVAEAAERLVGFRAFMRWRFDLDGSTVRAVRAVDTATHPDHQGRGIFRRLTTTAIEELRSEADLIFNTPNSKSLPGYLTMGWAKVTDVRISLKVQRPVRFVRHLRTRRGAGSPGPIAEPGTIRDDVWRQAASLFGSGYGSRLATVRDEAYLRWRYGTAPLLGYRIVEERVGHRLDGIAVYRTRSRGQLREATVTELIVAADDRRCGARLLRRIAREAPVDHLTCSFPVGSLGASSARRSGFLPSPEGMTLVANPLTELPVDVLSPRSWWLTIGDLEVF
jgi:GNAT superfamily N-acetyltransferase